jgi:hypothetical protein
VCRNMIRTSSRETLCLSVEPDGRPGLFQARFRLVAAVSVPARSISRAPRSRLRRRGGTARSRIRPDYGGPNVFRQRARFASQSRQAKRALIVSPDGFSHPANPSGPWQPQEPVSLLW